MEQGASVVLESDRAKTVGFIVLSGLFLTVLAFAPYNHVVMSGFGLALLWLVRIGAGFCLTMMVMRLIRPQRIELTPSGMIYFDGFRTFRFAWNEIESFQYLKRSFWAEMPGMVLMIASQSAPEGKKFPTLLGGWTVSLSELTDILNNAAADGRRATKR